MNDWLRLKLAGKDDNDIRKTLDKRYANYLERVRQLNSEDVFQTFMNAYADTIDPHTELPRPARGGEFRHRDEAVAGRHRRGAAGATTTTPRSAKSCRAARPRKSGKVKVGDRIVGVGQGDNGPIVDVIGWRLDDVVNLIRGKKDTTVRLEILPADAGPDGKHEIDRAGAQEGQHRGAGGEEVDHRDQGRRRHRARSA